MVDPSLARKMGIVGIMGAGLWVISVIMQYSLNLFAPDGSFLRTIHQLIALTAMAGAAVGFLGLIPGGAVVNWFGKAVVFLYAAARGLIILGGLVGLFMQGQDTPFFLVFPIGGMLSDLAALLIGIAVVTAKRWTGWQRWMPLVHFMVVFFALSLPFGLGLMPDGPGMISELVQGVMWLGVALAVFTSAASIRAFAVTPQASQQ